MKYMQETKWRVMQRLLPMLTETVKKRKEAERLKSYVTEAENNISKKRELLADLESMKKKLVVQRRSVNVLEEQIARIEADISGYEKELQKYQEKYAEAAKEIASKTATDNRYFNNMAERVKGIRIGKKQVSPQEIEGVLYLMWITGLPRSDFFEEYERTYPEMISKITKDYDGKSFYDASFKEVFCS